MEIKHACSLGSLCHASQFLKDTNLKRASYPFDWIFSSFDNITHCLEDNFKTFLDKDYYVSISRTQCGHKLYHDCMFNHYNPLDYPNDYDYYVRCVDRFQQLLQNEDHKLFLKIFVNMDEMSEKMKDDVIKFNDTLSKYAKNYTLLVIFHIKNNPELSHTFTHSNNIDFLELHTLTQSGGIIFNHDDDNAYLRNIIFTNYKFDIPESSFLIPTQDFDRIETESAVSPQIKRSQIRPPRSILIPNPRSYQPRRGWKLSL